MKCLELTVYQILCEHDHSSNTEFFTVKGEIGEGGEWWHQQEEESQGEGGQRGEEDKQHRLSGREEGERGRNKRWASTKEEKKKTDGVVGESDSRRNERHWERQTERERGEREKTLTTVLWARVYVCVGDQLIGTHVLEGGAMMGKDYMLAIIIVNYDGKTHTITHTCKQGSWCCCCLTRTC